MVKPIALAFSGGALVSGALLLAHLSQSPPAEIQNLEELKGKFTQNEGQRSAKAASDNWPYCEQKLNHPSRVCSDWAEGGVRFNLRAIRGRFGEIVPVFESWSEKHASRNGVVVHLSGGTDLPPYSNLSDIRTAAFEVFHSRSYAIASLGYWGTDFRTTLEKNEILRASRDVEAAIGYYSDNCDCVPIIIAESLGAAVVFHYLSTEDALPVHLLAISPVMNGLGDAIEYYDESSATTGSFSLKTTRVYRVEEGARAVFVTKRLVSSLDHLKRFAGIQNTTPDARLLESRCPTFIVGREDPLNHGFRQWNLSSVTIVEGAEHDLFSANTPELRDAFLQFLRCTDFNSS